MGHWAIEYWVNTRLPEIRQALRDVNEELNLAAGDDILTLRKRKEQLAVELEAAYMAVEQFE